MDTPDAALRIDPETGWLDGVRCVPSPNCDARPDGVAIDLIVVHGISLPPGEYGGPWIDDLFLNRLDPGAHPYFAGIAANPVSAHVLIRRDGALTQYVPFPLRAWHAGQSTHRGRNRCNDFAIGIELEGCDLTPYEPIQYERLAKLVVALRAQYPAIAPDAVVGHCDIAPGRKTDPGPHFEWPRLDRCIAALDPKREPTDTEPSRRNA